MTSENVAITSNNGSSDVFVYFEDSQNNIDRYFEMIENLPEYTAYNSIEEAGLSIPEDVVVYDEMTPEESLACRTKKKNVVTKSTETGSTYSTKMAN